MLDAFGGFLIFLSREGRIVYVHQLVSEILGLQQVSGRAGDWQGGVEVDGVMWAGKGWSPFTAQRDPGDIAGSWAGRARDWSGWVGQGQQGSLQRRAPKQDLPHNV